MDLPIIYHPNYVVPLPEGHRFPMEKFGRLYQMLMADEVMVARFIHRRCHRENGFL